MLPAALLLLAAAHVGESDAPPNFVLVLADDQGWGDVGYNAVPERTYNGTILNPPKTPHLDAMAASPNSLVFHRFYASPVCSPTRASILTGRTPNRECIWSAEGCGQQPGWSCVDPLPLPNTVFSIADAVRKSGKNYSSLHVGKWHLGTFFPQENPKATYAYKKFPISHPGTHGFDEWHSTEASAASSTTNCGCFEPISRCVTGGGVFRDVAYPCTNYWSPTYLEPATHKATRSRPECLGLQSRQDCVGNLTSKIDGDDSEYMIDYFEDFLRRKTTGSERSPFLALLWLHTNHVPHPALPEFYSQYEDPLDGDYLGTLTQMDKQIGRLRAMLRDYGVAENTALWYTADNGPTLMPGLEGLGPEPGKWMRSCSSEGGATSALHPGGDRPCSSLGTNGLRQMKASVFEGGIRTPGMLEWPAKISQNRETWMPACTTDYLPTVMDVLGVTHPHPTWATDGMSLMPLIEGRMATPAGAEHPIRPKPLGCTFLPPPSKCSCHVLLRVVAGAQGQPMGIKGTPTPSSSPSQVAYMVRHDLLTSLCRRNACTGLAT